MTLPPTRHSNEHPEQDSSYPNQQPALYHTQPQTFNTSPELTRSPRPPHTEPMSTNHQLPYAQVSPHGASQQRVQEIADPAEAPNSE